MTLTLLNLQTPPAPRPAPVTEPSSVQVEPPNMNCDRLPRPKQPLPDKPQACLEGPKVVGAGIVHPAGHDNAGKAIWADPTPEHGSANFNFSAERNRNLGLIGGVASEEQRASRSEKEQRIGGKVVGTSLVLGRR
jgi:hypothetical protein